MKKLLILAAGCAFIISCNSDKTESKDEKKDDKMVSAATSADKKSPTQDEFADVKYMDWGKKHLGEFQTGDIDSWLSAFADNAKYYWSGGDSLVGKQAIADYWKNRRAKVIKEIKFSNDIWLPVKVNKPQNSYHAPGVWLLSWYMVNSTYNNGKSVQFWTHVDQHFDSNDKVDMVVQYIDMAPINKALGK